MGRSSLRSKSAENGRGKLDRINRILRLKAIDATAQGGLPLDCLRP
jgi:hypothetical protein